MFIKVCSFLRSKISKNFLANNVSQQRGLSESPPAPITSSFDFDKFWSKDEPYQVHLLDEKPSSTVELTREKGMQLYKDIHLIRLAEQMIGSLYTKRKIRGFCHLYIGQEAVAVGIHSELQPKDTIITSYRCHGWLLLKSQNLVGIFGELLGNKLGVSRGKGGSMHMFGKNFFGGNGIVGAWVPVGVGIGLKHKYTNSGAVSVTMLGDGTFNQGQVSEAFNLAKLQNLPILFVVENNFYGMGTSSNRSSANNDYYRASTYVPGVRASGMDILSVIDAARFCLKHIRDGHGPIILEMVTYRYQGHSMSDPGTSYRDRSEVTRVREEKDCLKNFAKLLEDSKLATEDELEALKKQNKKKVDADLAKALTGTPISMEELWSDIYSNYPGKIRLPPFSTEMPYKNVAKYDKDQ